MLTKDDLKLLSAEFPTDKLSVKVQSLSKTKDKALLVVYLQHTDVADRLDSADPSWTFEILSDAIKGDMIFVKSKLTVKSVSRDNYGEGQDYKSAASDALKRCAMLFGIGRSLYDQGMVWTPYNEYTDKYKHWTYTEYLSHAHKPPKSPAIASKPPEQPKVLPKESIKPITKPQANGDDLGKTIMPFGYDKGKVFDEIDPNNLAGTYDFIMQMKDKTKFRDLAFKIKKYLG